MTEEMKARIAQINAGIAPAGYKKTKVGIVPEEWEYCRLSHYLTVNKEKNTLLEYGKEDVFSVSGDYGVVNQIELLGRSYAGESLVTYKVVFPFNIVYTKSPLKQNPYGIIKSNQTRKKGIVSALYAVYSCGSNVHAKYVEYYFGLDTTLNNYLFPLVTIGPKHSMNINDENALQGFVVFPSLPEQQKIAEILTAQDRAIALMQKRIELKQQQKKALMQKLLSGEVRVGSGEWKKTKIGKLTTISAGATPDTKRDDYWNGDIRWMSSGELNQKRVFEVEGRITQLGLEQTSTKILPCKCVLIGLAGQGKTRGTAAINYVSLCTNQSIAAIWPSNYFVPEFLYYLMDSKYSELRMISSGDGTRGGLNLKLLGNLSIELPPLPEQEKIAEILSAQDREIELIQQQLALEQQKKKALMQLLLTGKVRCV